MSNFIKKAEEVLTGHHKDSTQTSNHGPHNSKLANKLDPRVDSDHDNRARHEAMGGAAGPHSSNVANKVDPRIDSDRDNRAAQFNSSGGHQTGTTGAHNSNVANKLDPRVGPGADNLAQTHGQSHGRVGGAYETTGASSTIAHPGPHSSNLANKLDPRVDSELDNAAGHQAATGSNYGNTTGAHGGVFDSRAGPGADNLAQPHGRVGGAYEPTGVSSTTTNAGPHSSNLANKLDPRVDSELGNAAGHQAAPGSNYSHTTGAHGGVFDSRAGPGADNLAQPHGRVGGAYEPTGVSSTSTNAGPHSSNLANKLDPRVDSDLDNRARHQAIAGSSYGNPLAGATAGPHASNTANKLDPRVDSDLDNRNAGVQRIV
ncbi:hypothetical protein N7510_003621 [Penicillium lagena]|uniref:uncharacterized protein n=1 Tax=Penicillium lagena TaxID=94218 RepID=UPI00254025FF|nr:uncharacterized protein N7510_003621 [Penicillium lagena]KAJ5619637.1 hypothetical protein N7510_003621 [Penicillium lagena]